MLQFLKVLAISVLVSYKLVSYKKRVCDLSSTGLEITIVLRLFFGNCSRILKNEENHCKSEMLKISEKSNGRFTELLYSHLVERNRS